MRNKSHGLEAGDILTYNEYLDNANAEMSPDTAPTLIPVLDGAGNVTMTSFMEVLQTNKQLAEAQDISKAIATLDIEHWFIHRGLHFFNSQCLAIPGNTTWNWVVETGDKAIHVIFTIDSNDGALFFETFENITADANGTEQDLINNNRLSSIVSTATMRLNPTNISTVGSQKIRCARLGVAGATAQRRGGSITRGNEVIFKKNTKYLLRMQNLVNDINYVNLTHSWYENGL